jgi:chromosome partitioning protein
LRVVIVTLLNQKGGVGKRTLALHLAGAWAAKGRHVTLVDADPQGSALDWSEQRVQYGGERLFGVLGLARETLHRELPAIAADFDHVIVDGAPRVTGVARSALLAAHVVLVPATPSPLDGWASAEMLRLLDEARVFRPDLVARMVLNRCATRTVIAREIGAAMTDQQPPMLATRIGQRVIFAEAACTGRLVHELDPGCLAAAEIASLANEVEGLAS